MARSVCQRCQRPEVACVCRHLGPGLPLPNRTGIIILQHPRERLHPLGTVRLARLGLAQVRVEVAGGKERSLAHPMELPAGTALLYPHPRAIPLDQLAPRQRPPHLLLLDGTWSCARKLYQANPWLDRLPCVGLPAGPPGRYRIRREPDPRFLATIEAVARALTVLEPETPGLDQLLDAFERTIDAQLAQVRGRAGEPRRKLRFRPQRRWAGPLLQLPAEQVVLVHVEAAPGASGQRRPVHWVATRPASGETLECLLEPGPELTARHLEYMGLTAADLAGGVSRQRFERQWQQFLGPSGVVLAWNQRAIDLVRVHTHGQHAMLALKRVYCNRVQRGSGALEQVLEREGLTPGATPFGGRAALRAGQLLAVYQQLDAAARQAQP